MSTEGHDASGTSRMPLNCWFKRLKLRKQKRYGTVRESGSWRGENRCAFFSTGRQNRGRFSAYFAKPHSAINAEITSIEPPELLTFPELSDPNMTSSIIEAQRHLLLETIHGAERAHEEHKTLILDSDSARLVFNLVSQDELVKDFITHIEQITDVRPAERDRDAIYFLTPKPHIIDCLIADFRKRKYRGAYLLWTSKLHPRFEALLSNTPEFRSQILALENANVDFFPRESRLTTFRDPASFYNLYHPACGNLVGPHLQELAYKIVNVCVCLGETPYIRYYAPVAAHHEAKILCELLAQYVQEELDHNTRPPLPKPPNRMTAALYIVDRSLDLFAPLLHETTFQTMAFDLLPIEETTDGKLMHTVRIDKGTSVEGSVTFEITEREKVWAEARHLDMKDASEGMGNGLRKFRAANPELAGDDTTVSLSSVKFMMAGLSDYQAGERMFKAHIAMAEQCINAFTERKLLESALIEQTLATGLDDFYKIPKGVAEQIVRTLDMEGLELQDRKRLLMLYVLFKNGLVPADAYKLLAHARLPPQDGEAIENMALLGARTSRKLKDPSSAPTRLFQKRAPPPNVEGDISIIRFETALKGLLEGHAANTLDLEMFRYVKPSTQSLVESEQLADSLRSKGYESKWAKTARADTKQRVIVFMAGGATYSEARACYEVGRATKREIHLVTSHMAAPSLFVEQIQNLSAERRRLCLPADQPPEKAPAHLFEPDRQPVHQEQATAAAQMPVHEMGNMKISNVQPVRPSANTSAKISKEAPEKEKKRKGLLGFGKRS